LKPDNKTSECGSHATAIMERKGLSPLSGLLARGSNPPRGKQPHSIKRGPAGCSGRASRCRVIPRCYLNSLIIILATSSPTRSCPSTVEAPI
jgi:hypothetical protein